MTNEIPSLGEFHDTWVGSDAEFLRWLADWLDKIDPILQAVYGSTPHLSQEEREKVVAWLAGNDVQERIRAIAAGHTDLGRPE